jgi:hypothetical protein
VDDGAAHGVIDNGGQAGPGVTVLAELALQQEIDVAAVLGANPAALDEQVGQRGVLARRPQRTGLGELAGVDQVGLQAEDAEEQVGVAVEAGGRGGHGMLQGSRDSSTDSPVELRREAAASLPTLAL